MQIACIHEIDSTIVDDINKNYNDFLLTFDDGLYTQYLNKDLILNKNRIYFICPSLINTTNNQSDYFVTCREAMTNHFFDNDNQYYMNIDQIKDLINEGYKIGAHSFAHRHIKYEINSDIIRNYMSNTKGSLLCIKDETFVKEDTNKMLEWFNKYLNIQPIDYCYPFNQKTDKLENILKQYGFTNFYGENRIIITK